MSTNSSHKSGSYHIGKNGPDSCGATKRRCPLQHYDTCEEANRAYIESYPDVLDGKSKSNSNKFAAEMNSELSRTDDYLYSTENRNLTWGTMVRRSMVKKLTEDLQRPVYEEDIVVAARGLAASLADSEGHSLRTTLREYYKAVESRLRHPSNEMGDDLPTNWSAHSGKPIGKRDVAETLQKFVNSNDENIDELLTSERTPPGFTYLGRGAEQIAVLHNKSGVVYKVSRWINEGNTETTLNNLAAAEAFPTQSGIRHARTSAYAFGNKCIVAQERITSNEEVVSIPKQTMAWLHLSGHEDTSPDNYGIDEHGDLVCFDTNSTVYDDALDYRPGSLTSHD